MNSTIESVRDSLSQLPRTQSSTQRWYVAFSGGLDSTVLLHILKTLSSCDSAARPVTAIYVDHGLQSASKDWAKHCEDFCKQLGVAFESMTFSPEIPVGASMEAVARELRYSAFREYLQAEDIIFLAHHADDQTETLLLNLLRGSGPAGLSAMPKLAPLEPGWICRPMLNIQREDIQAYAQEHQLQWIEDPSNQDTDIDRNYLRHRILPGLRERWPGLNTTIGRAAQLQAGSQRLLQELAELDQTKAGVTSIGPLPQAALCELNQERQANLIRHWLSQQGFKSPPQTRMQSLLDLIRPEPDDRVTEVQWQGCVVNGWRGNLYARRPTPAPLADFSQSIYPQADTELANKNGTLSWRTGPQGLDKNRLKQHQLTLRSRQGGERIRLHTDGPNRELKKLYQEQNIPPWERVRRPLLYADDTFIAVPGLFVHADWRSKDGIGPWPEWKPISDSPDNSR